LCTIIPRLTVSFQPEPHSGVDSRRDPDGDLPLHLSDARSAAIGTAGLGHLPEPPAFWAGGHPDELAKNTLAHLAELPAPPALGAGNPFLRAAPGTPTGRARFRVGDLDLPLGPEYSIVERYPEIHQEV
jgi:hypothetical protein